MSGIVDFFKRVLGITSDTPGEAIVARVWELPSEYWADATLEPADVFPEWRDIAPSKRDFGVAFSGGGTRSMSASVGQLRGLARNGWLQKVGYISCVSGGSWAAVPFTFSQYDEATLLGDALEPGQITWESLRTTAPRSMNNDIANASLNGGQVVVEILRRLLADNKSVQSGIATVVGRFFDRDALDAAFSQVGRVNDLTREATYARLLSDAFLVVQVPGAEGQYFTWRAQDARDIRDANPGMSFPNGFALAHTDRPYVIANAAVLHRLPGYAQTPVPVEYTPLYSGIRQHFSPVLGGNYVWSAAYGTHAPSILLGGQRIRGYVRATTRAAARPFSLADVIASSGAAPEFLLTSKYGADLVTSLASQAGQYFPRFPTWSVRDSALGPVLRDVPHADGGAIENLGLLALLARQVHNVIVFVNANEHYNQSDDLRAICGIGTSGNVKEQHGLCQVFAPERWHDIQREFEACETRDEPLVFCASGWDVLPNRLFNVQGFSGLNICFVYNYPVESWRKALPPDVRDRVPRYPNQRGDHTDEQLVRFPWYETLAEQRTTEKGKPTIRLLALQPPVTQLLSHLGCWSLVHDASRKKIEGLFQGSSL
jgi:hypothetical protein